MAATSLLVVLISVVTCPNFVSGVGLDGADLLAKLLVALQLVFLDGLRQAARAGQFILGEAELLGGDVQFGLQFGDARVGLAEFRVNRLSLFVRGVQSRAGCLAVVVVLVEQISDQSEGNDKKQQNPARQTRMFPRSCGSLGTFGVRSQTHK